MIDIVTLVTSLDDYKTIPGRGFVGGYSCKQIYDLVGFGSAWGLVPEASPDVIEKNSQRLKEMNRVLAETVEAMHNRSGPYAGFQGHVLLLKKNEPPNDRYTDYISGDCIHPNRRGQQLYGDLLWEAVHDNLGDAVLSID